jgi:hypothetical protein
MSHAKCSKSIILNCDELSILALNHKKPFILQSPLRKDYQDLSPLTTQMPDLYQNLVPLIENYFNFETLDREAFIKKSYHKFYPHAETNLT